mgnify:CR=1 FL=1
MRCILLIPFCIVRIPNVVAVMKIISAVSFPFIVLSENIKMIMRRRVMIIFERYEYFILWMFFAMSFEIRIAIMNEVIPEIRIVKRII